MSPPIRGIQLPNPYTLDQSGAVPVIDIADNEIHQGLHFTASSYQIGASAFNVLITAPSEKIYHFNAEVESDGPCYTVWSKDPGYDATGSTVITAYNNNENSSNTSLLSHVKGGDFTSSGTILEYFLLGGITGAGGSIKIGGMTDLGRQWTLAYNSIHLIRVVPTATCTTAIRMYYYRGGEV